MGYECGRVFRPVSPLYLLMLLGALVVALGVAYLFLGDILVSVLGLPAGVVGIFFFVSLFGSFVNFPVATLESRVPMVRVREVSAFGVRWQVPEVRVGVARTHILVNLGGAVLPMVVSGYLLAMPLRRGGGVVDEYLAIAAVLAMVTALVHQSAQVIEGLGVATPALVPPIVTAVATILVDWVSPLRSPAQVAYIGGTLGTLIGADLLNLGRVRDIGAPVVSIGGAGTFDGVYLTGIVSVMLVFLALG